MKKRILLALMTISLSGLAGEISYFSGSWKEALSKAKAENKYVMLDCYTYWCYWCKVMDNTTLQSDTALGLIDQKFICVKRDMEKDSEGVQLCMKYFVSGYPTYLFFNSDGKLTYVTAGYYSTVDFMAELNNAIDPGRVGSFPGLSDEMDPGYPAFYKRSFQMTDNIDQRIQALYPPADTVNGFLDKQSDLKSEVSWAVMQRFMVNGKYGQWILDNIDTLRKLYGRASVDDKVNSILRWEVDSAGMKKDEKRMEQAISDVDKYFPGQDNSATIRSFRIEYCKLAGDWMGIVQLFATALDTMPAAHIGGFAIELKSAIGFFGSYCEDVKANEAMMPVLQKIAENTNDYFVWDNYASVAYHAQQYASAKPIAEKAIELEKAANADTTATTGLLKKINRKLKH